MWVRKDAQRKTAGLTGSTTWLPLTNTGMGWGVHRVIDSTPKGNRQRVSAKGDLPKGIRQRGSAKGDPPKAGL
eukprot:359258-Chlamydomonas_euryale.AAC.27